MTARTWNQHHPIGTRVQVTLTNGAKGETVTTSEAFEAMPGISGIMVKAAGAGGRPVDLFVSLSTVTPAPLETARGKGSEKSEPKTRARRGHPEATNDGK